MPSLVHHLRRHGDRQAAGATGDRKPIAQALQDFTPLLVAVLGETVRQLASQARWELISPKANFPLVPNHASADDEEYKNNEPVEQYVFEGGVSPGYGCCVVVDVKLLAFSYL